MKNIWEAEGGAKHKKRILSYMLTSLKEGWEKHS